jgi:hypothetical protein
MHCQDGQVVRSCRRRAVQARRFRRPAAMRTHPPGCELLRDIHASVCGHHAAPRTLVGNAFCQGFYWPTAVADTSEIVHTCEGCQFYARKSNLPAHVLQTIHAPRIARSARINCRQTARSLMGGTHHDRSCQAHVRARSLRCGNRRAAAGRHIRPPTSPATRAAAAPEKRARSAELWTRLWALNGPVPYQVRTTLEWPEHEALKTRPSKGAITDQWRRSPLSVNGRHRCPRSTKITDQWFEGRPGCKPSKLADVKSRG